MSNKQRRWQSSFYRNIHDRNGDGDGNNNADDENKAKYNAVDNIVNNEADNDGNDYYDDDGILTRNLHLKLLTLQFVFEGQAH